MGRMTLNVLLSFAQFEREVTFAIWAAAAQGATQSILGQRPNQRAAAADQPGFGSTAFFAGSGLLDALTHQDGPPAFSLPAQGDQMAGMNLFAAISMALLHRERTGLGSEVSTSLHAGGLWSNAMLAQGALLGAYVAPRPPRHQPRSALANQYKTPDGRC